MPNYRAVKADPDLQVLPPNATQRVRSPISRKKLTLQFGRPDPLAGPSGRRLMTRTNNLGASTPLPEGGKSLHIPGPPPAAGEFIR
jgi:hypothetical protein